MDMMFCTILFYKKKEFECGGLSPFYTIVPQEKYTMVGTDHMGEDLSTNPTLNNSLTNDNPTAIDSYVKINQL